MQVSHRLICRARRQHELIEGVEAQAIDLRLMRLNLLRPRCMLSICEQACSKGPCKQVLANHFEAPDMSVHGTPDRRAL